MQVFQAKTFKDLESAFCYNFFACGNHIQEINLLQIFQLLVWPVVWVDMYFAFICGIIWLEGQGMDISNKRQFT